MRIILAFCIAVSIAIMYYVNVVEKDYIVITNVNGPDIDSE